MNLNKIDLFLFDFTDRQNQKGIYMNIQMIGHNKKYETEVMCSMFFKNEPLNFTESIDSNNISIIFDEPNNKFITEIIYNGKTSKKISKIKSVSLSDKKEAEEQKQREIKQALKNSFYLAAKEITGKKIPWGVITGIRPSKPVAEMLKSHSEDEVKDILKNEYFLQNNKIELVIKTALANIKASENMQKKGVSLYIAIPFCPSRCNYCSFVSHAIEKAGVLLDDYFVALLLEIHEKSEIIKKYGLSLETIYIGGGTPAVLSPVQINRLFTVLDKCFDLKTVREITFEAGRPDAITEDKLKALAVIKEIRISINPQTLNDDVLKIIGRNHTAKEFFNAYNMAYNLGFKKINTDLIAGLSGDNFESFKNTVDEIVKLSPSNITVHTLSVKRAANITKNKEIISSEFITEKMLDYSADKLLLYKYSPYYLYRQRNTIANLENIGYSLENESCLYNIYMMEELQSVFSCGAGAVTKLIDNLGKIERIFNYKYPYEYLSGKKHDESEELYNVFFEKK